MKRAVSILMLLLMPMFLSASANVKAESTILSEEELAYIAEHPVVTVGVDPEFKPYEFIDNDGLYKGIAADYLKLIEIRTGLSFDIQEDLSWSETYDLAVAGDIDVLPIVGKVSGREAFFLFSDTYMTYQRVLLSYTGSESHSFKDIDQYTVGVQRNTSHYSYLTTETEAEVVTYSTLEELLFALSSEEIELAVVNDASSRYAIKQLGITNLRKDAIYSEDTTELAMAITGKNEVLHSIINKALNAITEEEKIQIQNKWLGIEQAPDYSGIIRNILIGTAIGLVVLGATLYWSYTLKREIGRRTVLEGKLKDAKAEADRANDAKSIFLAHMSHEIRTPLNAISGATYLLENTETTATQKKYIRTMKSASNNLLNVITDILDFSKIEAGEVRLERVDFSLDDVLDRVSRILMPKISDKELNFHVQRSTDVPTMLIGDPTRLEQILINLINNAVKFTEKGEINLKVQQTSVASQRSTLKFSVIDTGIGISQDKMSNLFTPFHQLDTSITRQYGGTGLGLSITKNLVEMMDGTIQVQSSLGIGSSFIFELPFDVKTQNDQKKERWDLGRIKALLVDDDLSSLKIIDDYLDSYGVETKGICCYEEIYNQLKAPYNLLIMSQFIAGKSTIEMAKAAKAMGFEVILLADKVNEGIINEAEEVSISHVIMKPVIASILFDTIVQCFADELIPTNDREISKMPEDKMLPENNHKILLVEDNEVNQIIAKEILVSRGYRVHVASNGMEAVDYMSDGLEADLILMDIHMPVMDGYEATRQIRAFNADIPILAMTAVSYSQIKDAGTEAGMNGYVTKPVDPDKMFATLRQHLSDSLHTVQDSSPVIQKESVPYVNTKQGIQRLNNNEALYYKVLRRYYDDMLAIGDDVSKLIKANELEKCAKLVHTIKGSTGSVSAVRLFQSSSLLNETLNSKIDVVTGPYPYLLEYEKDLRGTMAVIEELLNDYEGSHLQSTEPKENTGVDLSDKKEQLKVLLQASDMDAFKILDEIEQFDADSTTEMKQIRTHMDKFDFKSALDML